MAKQFITRFEKNMDYKEALKQVQATKKPKENFFLIQIGYDFKILIPHKDGIAFMTSLASAEQLNEPYKEPHRITEVEKDKIRFSTFSHEDYERYKIAALLGITHEEVKAAQNAKPETTE